MKLGGVDIDDFKFGTEQVDKIMVGVNEVWSKGGTPPTGPTYRYWGITLVSKDIATQAVQLDLTENDNGSALNVADSSSIIAGISANTGSLLLTDGDLNTVVAFPVGATAYWDCGVASTAGFVRMSHNGALTVNGLSIRVRGSDDDVTWVETAIIDMGVQSIGRQYTDSNYVAITELS